MKKSILFIGLFLAVSFIFYIRYTDRYSIAMNDSAVQEAIEKQLQSDIEITKTVVMGNSLHFVFTIGGEVGSGELRKGWNLRYKFEYAGHGTNKIRERILNTGKRQYLIVAGRNNENIGQIKAYIDDNAYDISIPDDPFYLVIKPIRKTQQNFTSGMTVYDREGHEISRNSVPIEQRGGLRDS